MNQRQRDARGDYLWDRSGPADLEIERLERQLRPAAWSAASAEPDWRRVAIARAGRGSREQRQRRRLLAAAAAILVAVASGAVWLTLRNRGPSWSVESLTGGAAIDGRAIDSAARLRRGQSLTTGAGGRVRLGIDWLGSVEVGPGSELSMVGASEREHRMRLERGTIRALIAAPPRRFAVETPAAAAIDMGCAYTLSIEGGGEGSLEVESGWVALVGNGREAFLPAGSRARIAADRGPGTPVWNDASLALATSVAALDGEWRPNHLRTVLDLARRRDALTLWHLLVRAPREDREAIAARLSAFAPPPDELTRRRATAGDREALDAWWQTLGLGSSAWWRLWRQPVPAG